MPRYSFPIARTGKVMKSKVFDVPGDYSWAVPAGVTEVYITGCGAGGSGGLTIAPAVDGTDTVFSNLLILKGGKGNSVLPTGAGGGGCVPISSGGDWATPTRDRGGLGGAGYSGSNSNYHAAVGDGGGGADGYIGGAAGDYTHDKCITVSPNNILGITIGKGGAVSSGAGSGGDGLLIIKWNE